jgi:hypothetical protein
MHVSAHRLAYRTWLLREGSCDLRHVCTLVGGEVALIGTFVATPERSLCCVSLAATSISRRSFSIYAEALLRWIRAIQRTHLLRRGPFIAHAGWDVRRVSSTCGPANSLGFGRRISAMNDYNGPKLMLTLDGNVISAKEFSWVSRTVWVCCVAYGWFRTPFH